MANINLYKNQPGVHSEKGHQVVRKGPEKSDQTDRWFADKDYNLRLKELALTILETRRKSSDLIEAFKIIKGFEDVDSDFFYPLEIKNAHLRGYDLTIFKKGIKLNI